MPVVVFGHMMRISTSGLSSGQRQGPAKVPAARTSIRSPHQRNVAARWSLGPKHVPTDSEGPGNDIPEVVQVAGEVRGDAKLRAALSPNYNILRFLHPVQPSNISRIRLAAALSAETYHMKTLVPSKVMRKYKMRLVTTSMACECPAPDDRPSGATRKAIEVGDGMTDLPAELIRAASRVVQRSNPRSAAPERWQPHLASSAVVCLHDDAPAADAADDDSWLQAISNSVRDFSDAASKAAAVAATPIANGLTAVGAANLPIEAGATLSTATISAVTAIASAGHRVQQLSSAGWISQVPAPQTPAASGFSCPCHWFVADDDVCRVRYFVIQGTDCLDAWSTNLTFDPLVFESEELGVKVHRGVYESAKALYERFEPLVIAHLASDPLARVAFTGHSLGGALATTLALMLRRRGVITHPHQLAAVYTFGTAAAFCESVPATAPAVPVLGGPVVAAEPPPSLELDNKLLRTLGLPESSVINVLSTRDIVPRAFACDYSSVAALLMKWQPIYAQHAGLLTPSRKMLYHLLGQQLILQPSGSLTWVKGDPEHPLVPSGPGLWRVAKPTTLSQLSARYYTRRAAAACDAVVRRDDVSVSQQKAYLMPNVPEAASASEALLHFMDKPHPLTVLADPAAYGHKGIISRYHNPDNYAMALRELARNAVPRRLQDVRGILAMLASEQVHRSRTAWERWLEDWAILFTMCKQTGAAVSEAAALVWLQAADARNVSVSRANVMLLRRLQVAALTLRNSLAQRASQLSAESSGEPSGDQVESARSQGASRAAVPGSRIAVAPEPHARRVDDAATNGDFAHGARTTVEGMISSISELLDSMGVGHRRMPASVDGSENGQNTISVVDNSAEKGLSPARKSSIHARAGDMRPCEKAAKRLSAGSYHGHLGADVSDGLEHSSPQPMLSDPHTVRFPSLPLSSLPLGLFGAIAAYYAERLL